MVVGVPVLLLQATEQAKEVKRLNQLLQALELASTGDASALLADTEGMEELNGSLPVGSGLAACGRGRPGQLGATKVNLAEIKQQLQRQLKQQVCCSAFASALALNPYCLGAAVSFNDQQATLNSKRPGPALARTVQPEFAWPESLHDFKPKP